MRTKTEPVPAGPFSELWIGNPNTRNGRCFARRVVPESRVTVLFSALIRRPPVGQPDGLHDLQRALPGPAGGCGGVRGPTAPSSPSFRSRPRPGAPRSCSAVSENNERPSPANDTQGRLLRLLLKLALAHFLMSSSCFVFVHIPAGPGRPVPPPSCSSP